MRSPIFNIAILGIMIVALTSCQFMTGATAGENIDDTSITTTVKAKLAAEKVATLTSIGVETNLRIVHLTGVVETEALRQRAGELARGVKGVRNVTNDITVRKGRYQVRSRRPGGDEKNVRGDTELPPDVYNGMVIMVLRNLPKDATETVHVLAFTPKPTLVQLEMKPIGEENVLVGARQVPATHFVLKPKLGLLKGAIAALLGKAPSDYHSWIITRPVPAFVNIDGPLYNGGPIWRFETVSPRGPARPPDSAR
jgi:hypothetical protein